MGIRIDLSNCRQCKTLLPCLKPLLSNPLPDRVRPSNAIKAGAALKPNQPLSRIALGWVFAIESKWEKAEKHLKAALLIEPNNELALALLESVKAESSVPVQNIGSSQKIWSPRATQDDMVFDLRKGIEQGNAKAAFTLGKLHLRNNRSVYAIRVLTQALNSDMYNPDIRYYLAMAYLLRGFETPAPSDKIFFASAQAHLNYILDTYKNNIGARIAIAKLHLLQGDRKECARILKILLRKEEDENAKQLLALIGPKNFYKVGPLELAKVIFNMVGALCLPKETR